MKQYKRIFRRYFNKIKFNQESILNLLSFQIESYKDFLGHDGDKKNSGIYKVLRSLFPVEIKNKNLIMEFLDYRLVESEYTFQDCKRNAMTYSHSLFGQFRLVLFSLSDKGEREVVSFKDQEIFLCDIPMISDNGSFMINGIERVVVSQMHKSSGVFFGHDKGKTNSLGRELYNASIVPYRGAWIEFEFDPKDCINFKIDRKKKLPVTIFLKFLGLDRLSIVHTFYEESVCKVLPNGEYEQNALHYLSNVNHAYFPVLDAKTRKVIIKSGSKITRRSLRKLTENNVTDILLNEEQMIGKYLYNNIINDKKEVVVSAGSIITKEILSVIRALGIKEVPTALLKNTYGPAILDTLISDTLVEEREVVLAMIRAMGVTEVADVKVMKKLINSILFSEEKYNLSEVGRFKINQRLSLDTPLDQSILTKEDIIETLRALNKMKSSQDVEDDIDNLSNRRLRRVGESVENQFRSGVMRLTKQLQDKSLEINPETCLPINLLGIKPLNAVMKEFFTLSQLSQFMDHTNPLSSLSHKRRISALGPGGVTKERATFEIRDVHMTHYGRLCAIETPEGQATGLIHSPTMHASIDKYGFMTVPYYRVVNGKRTSEIVHLSASNQYNKRVVSVLENIDSEGRFVDEIVKCRYKDEVTTCRADQIDFVEIIPMQIVSLTASHIPFLNNNDAIRSLYGSNMQRQAVPLLNTDSPLVATGVEKYVVRDTGVCVYAKYDGEVEYVDSKKIIIRNDSEQEPVTVYDLIKFDYSNHKTCIHQKVNNLSIGAKVKKGDMVIYGHAIENEEMALGKNVFIAFMPWSGLNYEDAIIISSRLANDLVSLHVEALEVQVRDTKLGQEELTADVPGVPRDKLNKLDEVGIIRIGAEISPGDIVVGKVTPKSEGNISSEEKLLRAIFGDKATNVQNSSLMVPSGTFGTVIDVEVFTRRGVEKDDRTLLIEKKKIKEVTNTREKEINIIQSITKAKIKKLLNIDIDVLDFKKIISNKSLSKEQKAQIAAIEVNYNNIIQKIDDEFNRKVKLMNIGHDLPQGVLKVVKIYIVSRRKIQVGDKMSGRHGNKGVVSSIVDEADMPFMDCGTPVDMILNSLGIPGRMNIGQILETHLGFASKMLGEKVKSMVETLDNTQDIKIDDIRAYVKQIYEGCDDLIEDMNKMSDIEFRGLCNVLSKGVPFATPVFDGANYKDIQRLLELAGVSNSGQVALRDGRTGEYFDRKITVGYKYMLKLHHLVDDKIHARSVGPYSLVTQQPLGGKARSGAQRCGEMEFWSLQAHGAAHTLQEMYTMKSDDIKGRNRLYSSLISDENYYKPGVAESFKVMLKECAALCFDIILNTEFDEKDAGFIESKTGSGSSQASVSEDSGRDYMSLMPSAAERTSENKNRDEAIEYAPLFLAEEEEGADEEKEESENTKNKQ